MKYWPYFFLFWTILAVSNLSAQPWVENIAKENPNFYDLQKSFEDYWTGKPYEKGKGWKQFKRWEWFMQSRVDQNGNLDPTALWSGWQEKQQNFGQRDERNGDWTILGPQEFIPEAGGAGRLNCIAFDPTDADIIWVGSPSGGLWKSVDAGQTWATNTDYLPTLGVTAIVIDHTNPDIMYIGTGDGDAGDTYSVGVLKSTNGGENWEMCGLNWYTVQARRISSLIMHPEDNQFLIAATDSGIYKSVDGGENWDNKITGNYKDLEIDPTNPDVWFAASTRIYRSTDSGENWTMQGSGLPNSSISRVAIDIAPSHGMYDHPSIIYALFANSYDAGFYGVYRSIDGGENWTTQATSPNLLGWQYDGSDNGGQGWYDLTIGVSPVNPDNVYVGGVNQWKSIDGGVNWTLMSHWWGDNAPYVHADHHAFEFHPDDASTIFSGNDGGLFKSTNRGATWTDLSNGLGIHQFYRIGAAAANSEIVYGGAQDNGTSRYAYNNWTRVMGGDGMECAVNPLNSNIVYGEYYYGYMERSANGGQNFYPINDGILDDGAWVTPFVIDPVNPATLYKGTARIYQTTNGGSYWTPLTGSLGSKMIDMAVSPSDPNVVYALNSRLNRTTDQGLSWNTFTLPGTSSYVSVHPNDPMTVWISLTGFDPGHKVYKSTDGGATWTNISGDLPNIPMNTVVPNPLAPQQLFVGSDLGVFFSPTGNGDWEDFSYGLPNVIVTELEIHEMSLKIRAATYGRGLWESPLPLGSVAGQITLNGADDHSGIRISTVGNTHWFATTDAAGSYQLDFIPPGTYTLVAQKLGYQYGYIENVHVENSQVTSGIDTTLELTGPAPTDLVADSNLDEMIYLSWAVPAENPSYYRVYRQIDELEDELALHLDQVTSPTVFDPEVANGITYWYAVTAVYDNPPGESVMSPTAQATPGVVLAVPTTIDFAADDGHFSVAIVEIDDSLDWSDNIWHWGHPESGPNAAHSDTHCWGTGLLESYPRNVDMWLISPRIDLTNLSSAYLSFYTWYTIQASATTGVDGGRIQATTNGGISWSLLTPVGGYPYPAVVPFDMGPGISGTSDGWVEMAVDLSAYAGQTIQVGFQFAANQAIEWDGWFIDDVTFCETVGIEEVIHPEAYTFELCQNQPNPFNPVTTITFSLAETARTNLTVYDASGRLVENLLDKEMGAGRHHYQFDAGYLASGVYLYRLEMSPENRVKEVITRRMVLLK